MHLRLIRLSGVFKLYYLSGIKTKEQTLSDYFIINCEMILSHQMMCHNLFYDNDTITDFLEHIC